MPASDTPLQESAQHLFEYADVRFNGDRPWDIQVHNPELYRRLLVGGSLGMGESYIEGWWDAEALDVLFDKVIGAMLVKRLTGVAKMKIAWRLLESSVVNFQTTARAGQVAEAHYDLGNDLFERMLDPSMNYSCGYWANADNLEQAQQHKMDLICRKLKLEPGMRVLDIGCGWGSLAQYMAENHGVQVRGLTVSKEQQALAIERTQGLDVDIVLEDYRSTTGEFDRIVSVGMLEHVGRKNYPTYFQQVHNLLAADGICLIHTIGTEVNKSSTDPFIGKYIFPNGAIPSRASINNASLDLLRVEDWHNFGPDYDLTLMAWSDNFEASWPELQDAYSERFYRMWRYYLNCCAGYFRSRQGQLWQMVYTHLDQSAPYRSER